MASRRGDYVMSLELAMQREMAYCKKLESLKLKQGSEPGKITTPPVTTSLRAQSYDPRPISVKSPSSTPPQRPKPSQNPWPTSSPKTSPPIITYLRPRTTSMLRPTSLSPRGPAFFQKSIGSLQGSTASTRSWPKATPSASPMPNSVILNPPPQVPQWPGSLLRPKVSPMRPSAGPMPNSVLASPHPQVPKWPGSLPRPKVSPMQPTAGLTLLPRPTLTSYKRKETPTVQLHSQENSKAIKLFCKVCEVSCTSARNLKMHIQGHKHQSKVKKGLGKGKETVAMDVSDPQLHCNLCGIWCINDFSFKQHLNGKGHIMKMHAEEMGS